MGESQINFGDKLFFCGPHTHYVELFEDYEPCSAERDDGKFVDGYIVEMMSVHSFASLTPFLEMEVVDVTDRLSVGPLPAGVKVWMPTTS